LLTHRHTDIQLSTRILLAQPDELNSDAHATTEASFTDAVAAAVDKRFAASVGLIVRVATETFEEHRLHSAPNCMYQHTCTHLVIALRKILGFHVQHGPWLITISGSKLDDVGLYICRCAR